MFVCKISLIIGPPSGCRFHTRCPYAKEICSKKEPKLKDAEGRKVACFLVDENIKINNEKNKKEMIV